MPSFHQAIDALYALHARLREDAYKQPGRRQQLYGEARGVELSIEALKRLEREEEKSA